MRRRSMSGPKGHIDLCPVSSKAANKSLTRKTPSAKTMGNILKRPTAPSSPPGELPPSLAPESNGTSSKPNVESPLTSPNPVLPTRTSRATSLAQQKTLSETSNGTSDPPGVKVEDTPETSNLLFPRPRSLRSSSLAPQKVKPELNQLEAPTWDGTNGTPVAEFEEIVSPSKSKKGVPTRAMSRRSTPLAPPQEQIKVVKIEPDGIKSEETKGILEAENGSSSPSTRIKSYALSARARVKRSLSMYSEIAADEKETKEVNGIPAAEPEVSSPLPEIKRNDLSARTKRKRSSSTTEISGEEIIRKEINGSSESGTPSHSPKRERNLMGTRIRLTRSMSTAELTSEVAKSEELNDISHAETSSPTPKGKGKATRTKFQRSKSLAPQALEPEAGNPATCEALLLPPLGIRTRRATLSSAPFPPETPSEVISQTASSSEPDPQVPSTSSASMTNNNLITLTPKPELKKKTSIASPAGKKKTIVLAPGLEAANQSEASNLLRNHPLLQPARMEDFNGKNGTGILIWVRNMGSPYWPALICQFPEADNSPDEFDPVADEDNPSPDIRSMLFLETAFRYSVAEFKDMILVDLENVEEQILLVSKLNHYVVKKPVGRKPYNDALDLLREFVKIPQGGRQAKSFEMSQSRKEQKKALKPVKAPSVPPTPTPTKEEEERARPSTSYSLRQILLKNNTPVIDNLPEEGPSTNRLNRSLAAPIPGTSRASTSASSEGSETASEKSRKARLRPKVGGENMKKFAEDRFMSADRGFKMDAKVRKDTLKCATCLADILLGTHLLCHDLPHHQACLFPVQIKQKDGTLVPGFKCLCCRDKLCFLCKAGQKEEESPTKCCKCDLYFHRVCLDAWPQAEKQGSSGPITCPAHFCHTCIGEQKVFSKCRNIKALSGKVYRCLQCLATYHKPWCLPAGCLDTLNGRDLITCPKHLLPNLKVTQRRFGCLSCGIKIKSLKDSVSCKSCLQNFHPECVGEAGEGADVVAISVNYTCACCLYGLHPVYGQVVWFQQHGHAFWPARILWPREATGRAEFVKGRVTGEYSIKYFGANPSFWDKANRAVPLHLTTLKRFIELNVFKETDNSIKSAYEEASFFHIFVDDYRDTLLPKPEPYYKKIEKNLYRTQFTKRKDDQTDVCICGDVNDGKDKCDLDSTCHNRDTAIECNDKNCSAGARCKNRMFSKKDKDVDSIEVFFSTTKGWCVKAKRVFHEGEFIIEYCGEVVNHKEKNYRACKKGEEDPLYLLELDKNLFVDAEYYGNQSRLINHSCEPNARTDKYTSDGRPVVGIFAQQTIQVGEEITFDYAYGNNSTAPFRCRCGADSCRVWIGKGTLESSSEDNDSEPPSHELDQYDKTCAKCSFGGHVLCCEFDGCFKVYHRLCANLTQEPKNQWFCPDHPLKPSKGPTKRKATKKVASEPPAKRRAVETSKGSSVVGVSGGNSKKTEGTKTPSKSGNDVASNRKLSKQIRRPLPTAARALALKKINLSKKTVKNGRKVLGVKGVEAEPKKSNPDDAILIPSVQEKNIKKRRALKPNGVVARAYKKRKVDLENSPSVNASSRVGPLTRSRRSSTSS